MSIVEETKPLRKANIGNSIEGKEVGISAVINYQIFWRWSLCFYQSLSTSGVECFDEALSLVSYLVLPAFEVL